MLILINKLFYKKVNFFITRIYFIARVYFLRIVLDFFFFGLPPVCSSNRST